MNEPLDAQLLVEARHAILLKFRALETVPEGIANTIAFIDLRTRYKGGYFHEALQQLVADGCIEIIRNGRFLQLTAKGFNAARHL